jgi:hypothetical protein
LSFRVSRFQFEEEIQDKCKGWNHSLSLPSETSCRETIEVISMREAEFLALMSSSDFPMEQHESEDGRKWYDIKSKRNWRKHWYVFSYEDGSWRIVNYPPLARSLAHSLKRGLLSRPGRTIIAERDRC